MISQTLAFVMLNPKPLNYTCSVLTCRGIHHLIMLKKDYTHTHNMYKELPHRHQQQH